MRLLIHILLALAVIGVCGPAAHGQALCRTTGTGVVHVVVTIKVVGYDGCPNGSVVGKIYGPTGGAWDDFNAPLTADGTFVVFQKDYSSIPRGNWSVGMSAVGFPAGGSGCPVRATDYANVAVSNVPGSAGNEIYLLFYGTVTISPGSVTLVYAPMDAEGCTACASGAGEILESCTTVQGQFWTKKKYCVRGQWETGTRACPGLTTNDCQSKVACASCPAGKTTAGIHSIEIATSLGSSSFGGSAGALQIVAEGPAPALATPARLQIAPGSGGAWLIYGVDNALRQVRTDRVLADIVPVNNYRYEIRFYTMADAGPKIGTLYEPSGTAYETVVIENPDASPTTFNRLWVRELAAGTLSDYTWTESTQQWQLNTGGASRRESRSTAWDSVGTNRTDTIVIRNGDNQVVSKTVEQSRVFAWGTNLVQRIADPEGAALTNSWSYYQDAVNDGPNYGRLRQVTEPGGYWERYEYDATGRRVKTVAQFRDAPATANEAACRVVEFGYTPVAPADPGTAQPDVPRSTVVKLLGQETARSYAVIGSAEERQIQCQTPEAAWDAADNLVTVTRRYPDGSFVGDLQSIRYPDGTMRRYEYAIAADASAKTTTVWTGAATIDGSAVTNGTKTVSVVDPAGNPVLDEAYDVATGRLLLRTATAQTDGFGRAIMTVSLSGTNTWTYGCCGISSATDEEGIVSTYQYDALRRLTATTRAGIKTEHAFDPEGRVLQTIRWGKSGEGIHRQNIRYDLAGRAVSSWDALGNTTAYGESRNADGFPVETTTYPEQAAEIATYYPDGQLRSRIGTAVHAVRFDYGVEVPPGETVARPCTKSIFCNADGTDTAEWTKTYLDMLGRAYKVVYADGAVSRSFYSDRGQLVKEVDPDGVTSLYAYNDLGEQEYAALDMNRNGVIDFAGADRIRRAQNTVEQAHGTTVRRTTTTVFTTEGTEDTDVAGITDTSIDGLQSWTISHALTNHVQTVYDRAQARRTVTETAADGTQRISVHENARLLSVTVADARTNLIQSVAYSYDQHNRVSAATDARTGSTTYTYNNADQVIFETTPPPKSGESARTTRYEYDGLGRPYVTTLPDGNQVWYEFWGTGKLKKLTGARTYPVEYTYDYAGRLQTLKTWQNYNARSGAAVTTWSYHPQRGFLAAKRYADGHGPDYSYTAAGRLLARAWARGVATTYAYNPAGELDGADYSDGTPDVTFTYDRRGRCVGATGADPVELVYNDADQLRSETCNGGARAGLCLSTGYDALGRRSDMAVLQNGQTLAAAGYGYDDAARLAAISDGLHSATYSYATNSSLVGQIVHACGPAAVLTTTKTYDNLNRLRSVVSRDGQSAVVDSRSYTFNSAGQRYRTDQSDGSYWYCGYDSLGQLISARKYWTNGTAVAGQQFDYSYDDVGNRKTTTVNNRQSEYTANSLNQYTQRTVPGAVDIIGTAASNATVTVNNQTVTRQGEYFHKALTVTNSAAAAYPQSEIVAVKNNVGSQGEDAVTIETGHLFVPKSPETYTYDLDGNLTGDGRWSYTWDAENRLVAMETNPTAASPAVPRQRLEFAYDYLSRRIGKKVYGWNQATGSWLLATDLLFLHDGANLVAELDALDTPAAPTLLRSYLWGLDLSDTQQGAGGIGGLLLVSNLQSPVATNSFVAYDGNGNVTALVDAPPQTVSARYDYGPFGEPLRATGSAAYSNPFRYSTKFGDQESGLADFGLRHYHASSGRWLQRDPIEELGGLNLSAYVANNPVYYVDLAGLALYAFDGTGNTYEQQTHVGILRRIYQGEAEYEAGVGTSFRSLLDNSWIGGLTGYGGRDRLERMYQKYLVNCAAGDCVVDVVGFSRGAALAREFANMLQERGYAPGWPNNKIRCNVNTRFVGLFDTVGSFGIPGNSVNVGIRMDLPGNVQNASQAVAEDEMRALFPVTLLNRPQTGQMFHEHRFPGDHSDIGGGWGDEQNILAKDPLEYIWNEGRAAGVPFGALPARNLKRDYTPHDARNIWYAGGVNLIYNSNLISIVLNRGLMNPTQHRTFSGGGWSP